MFHCVVNFSIKTNEAVYNIFIMSSSCFRGAIFVKSIKSCFCCVAGKVTDTSINNKLRVAGVGVESYIAGIGGDGEVQKKRRKEKGEMVFHGMQRYLISLCKGSDFSVKWQTECDIFPKCGYFLPTCAGKWYQCQQFWHISGC